MFDKLKRFFNGETHDNTFQTGSAYWKYQGQKKKLPPQTVTRGQRTYYYDREENGQYLYTNQYGRTYCYDPIEGYFNPWNPVSDPYNFYGTHNGYHDTSNTVVSTPDSSSTTYQPGNAGNYIADSYNVPDAPQSFPDVSPVPSYTSPSPTYEPPPIATYSPPSAPAYEPPVSPSFDPPSSPSYDSGSSSYDSGSSYSSYDSDSSSSSYDSGSSSSYDSGSSSSYDSGSSSSFDSGSSFGS